MSRGRPVRPPPPRESEADALRGALTQMFLAGRRRLQEEFVEGRCRRYTALGSSPAEFRMAGLSRNRHA